MHSLNELDEFRIYPKNGQEANALIIALTQLLNEHLRWPAWWDWWAEYVYMIISYLVKLWYKDIQRDITRPNLEALLESIMRIMLKYWR